VNDSRAYVCILIWISVIVLVSNPLAQEPNNPFRIGLVRIDSTPHRIQPRCPHEEPGLIQ